MCSDDPSCVGIPVYEHERIHGKSPTGTIRRLMNGKSRGLGRVLRSVEFSRVQDRWGGGVLKDKLGFRR